jgi:hypothetical protein
VRGWGVFIWKQKLDFTFSPDLSKLSTLVDAITTAWELCCRIQIQLDSKSSKSTGFQLDLVCVIENPVEITWSDPYYRYTYTQFEGAARGRSAAR